MIIVGVICILTGSIRAICQTSKNEAVETTPKHGERRIVEDRGQIWTESYHAFPGWSRLRSFETLEEAKADKARWDEISKRVDEGVKVIVPQ